MSFRPDLSVILPCYRAAARAERSVGQLRNLLDRSALGSWEIIIVDDGGGDFPSNPWDAHEGVRLIRLARNTGKGAAVKAGMLAARGSARIYTDIDLPYGSRAIPVMAEYLLDGTFHVVLGDRRLPGSTYRDTLGWPRRVLSALSTKFIGTLVTGGFFDTQCGLKGVRGDVAELLFPLIHIDRFAFDVELVYLALRFNCDVKRIPVQLRSAQQGSTVRPVPDTLRAGLDVLRMKLRAIQGEYSCPTLEEVTWRDFRDRLARVPDPRALAPRSDTR